MYVPVSQMTLLCDTKHTKQKPTVQLVLNFIPRSTELFFSNKNLKMCNGIKKERKHKV